MWLESNTPSKIEGAGGVDVPKALIYIIGKSSAEDKAIIKTRHKAGAAKQMMQSKDIKTFFQSIIVQVIVFGKEIVHVQKVGVSHVPDQCRGHSFWRIFNIFLSELPDELFVHRFAPPVC